jgi:hypothetical protein
MLFLGLGLIIGFGTGWFCYRGRLIARCEQAEEQRHALEKNGTALQIENARAGERIRLVEEALQTAQMELAQERQFNISLHAELSRERANRSHVDQKLEHQKNDLLQLQQRLSHEIRALVQQVLEEKSQTLSDNNQSNLHTLLQPITDKIQEFKQKIEEQHYRETRELIVLHNKLDHLESHHRGHTNGSTVPAAPTSAVVPAPDDDEVLQYIPPALDSAESAGDLPDDPAAVTGEDIDSDEIRPFSPKQEVEIDNFLKRTLGRAQRKKPD